eukprot:scaffold245522_cov21-Tisochrysis_lutea.AAC.1
MDSNAGSRAYLVETMRGLQLRVSPDSFLQTNTAQAEEGTEWDKNHSLITPYSSAVVHASTKMCSSPGPVLPVLHPNIHSGKCNENNSA